MVLRDAVFDKKSLAKRRIGARPTDIVRSSSIKQGIHKQPIPLGTPCKAFLDSFCTPLGPALNTRLLLEHRHGINHHAYHRLIAIVPRHLVVNLGEEGITDGNLVRIAPYAPMSPAA